MDASRRGSLDQDAVADLIRSAAESCLSGSLRLTANKQIKVIFFDSGRPVFAIGSHADDQPERRFIEDGIATAEQIRKAKSISGNPNQLGATLVAMGLTSHEAVNAALKAVALRIIVSAFEWREGEYVLDPMPTASHPVNIDCTSEDCVLSGARRAAQSDDILNSEVGLEAVVAPAEPDEAEFGRDAKLNSIEGYVLSCVASAMQIEDISVMTGLSALEIRRAVYVLISLGLLTPLRDDDVNMDMNVDLNIDMNIEVDDAQDSANLFWESGAGDSGAFYDDLPIHPIDQPVQMGQEVLIDVDSIWNPPQWRTDQSSDQGSNHTQQHVPSPPAAPASVTGGDGGSADMMNDLASSPGYSKGPAAPPMHAATDIRVNFGESTLPWLNPPRELPTGPTSGDLYSGDLNSGPIDSGGLESGNIGSNALGSGGVNSGDLGAPSDVLPTVEPIDQILSKLSRRLERLNPSDLYQVLGVNKLASKATIQGAYEGLKRAYQSYRAEWPDSKELESKLGPIEKLVDGAYEILSDPEKRRLYDIPKSTPMAPAPPVIERGGAEELRPPAQRGELIAPARKPLPIEIPKTVSKPPSSPAQRAAANFYAEQNDFRTPADNPTAAADNYYRRGRAYYERHDFHTAAHMLREAVRLDPTRASYHYHLGMTLAVLSQARAVHRHDEGCHVTCKMGGGLQRNQRIRHEAEKHLLKAAEIEPSSFEIKLRLAMLYKEAGMEKKAEQYYHEVLLLNPRCKAAQVELGLMDSSDADIDPMTGFRRVKKKPGAP